MRPPGRCPSGMTRLARPPASEPGASARRAPHLPSSSPPSASISRRYAPAPWATKATPSGPRASSPRPPGGPLTVAEATAIRAGSSGTTTRRSSRTVASITSESRTRSALTSPSTAIVSEQALGARRSAAGRPSPREMSRSSSFQGIVARSMVTSSPARAGSAARTALSATSRAQTAAGLTAPPRPPAPSRVAPPAARRPAGAARRGRGHAHRDEGKQVVGDERAERGRASGWMRGHESPRVSAECRSARRFVQRPGREETGEEALVRKAGGVAEGPRACRRWAAARPKRERPGTKRPRPIDEGKRWKVASG